MNELLIFSYPPAPDRSIRTPCYLFAEPRRDRCLRSCHKQQPSTPNDMAPGILTTGIPTSHSPERGSRSPQEQSLLDSTADQEWVGRRPSSSSSGRDVKRSRRSSLLSLVVHKSTVLELRKLLPRQVRILFSVMPVHVRENLKLGYLIGAPSSPIFSPSIALHNHQYRCINPSISLSL